MLQMSVNVDVADVAGLVPLSLQVGFWRWRCRCPLVCDLVSAGVCRFVILPLQVCAGMWCCQCRCLQVCDVVIAGVCRHVMVSLQVYAGMWCCHCRSLQVCDAVIAGVCRHVMLSLQVSGNVCYDHLGHGYFLEDSVEQNNVINGNLGLGTRHGMTLMSDSLREWCAVDFSEILSESCGWVCLVLTLLLVFFLLSVLWRMWYRRCWI